MPNATVTARVRRSLVVVFGVVCGGSLMVTLWAIFAVGTAGDHRMSLFALIGVLGILVLACIWIMLRTQIALTSDGRLVKRALRFQEVDLSQLQEVRTNTERAPFGPVTLYLVDDRGETLSFSPANVYDRERDLLIQIANAVEDRKVPIAALVNKILSQATGRPLKTRGGGDAEPISVNARRQRLRLITFGLFYLLMILLPLLPLLGGAVRSTTPSWIPPVGLTLVALGVVLWSLVVVRQLRRRLVIDEAGHMRVDGFIGQSLIDLDSLQSVRLEPNKAVYERNQHAPPAGRIPRIVLRDGHDRQVSLRADDYWQPAHLVFRRILDGAMSGNVQLTDHAAHTLRYLAGEADPFSLGGQKMQ